MLDCLLRSLRAYHYLFSRTLLLLATFYIFYTIPLTFATGLVDPAKWDNLFPGSREWAESSFYTQYLSGILPALLWTGFFALCPLMFKSLANFGSNALSVFGAGEFSIVRRVSSCHTREGTHGCTLRFHNNRIHSSSVLLVRCPFVIPYPLINVPLTHFGFIGGS